MTTETEPPDSILRRAAAVARGPHAGPSCDAPTWAEPPVPWTSLRDYVVRCDSCDRPIAVRVDRDLVRRRDAAGHAVADANPVDPVTERLHARGVRGFAWRCLAAALAPLVLAGCAAQAGGDARTILLVALVSILPSAAYAPAAVALGVAALRARTWRGLRRRGRTTSPVELSAARWDQWHREERVRERERRARPDAVLRELERVLNERELRRVRMLAERGDVPADHLDDLLRFRRAWRSVA